MEHGVVIVAMLAGLTLGANGALAQRSLDAVTTNTYSASSTAEDISASCKEMAQRSGGELSAYCNKADSGGDVSAVWTTLSMPKYANCRTSGDGYTMQWGEQLAGIKPVAPKILLSSTGHTYLLQAGCEDGDGNSWAPTMLDIGDTTDGLENDAGSLAKR